MADQARLRPVDAAPGQWPEARAFSRSYGGNPHAQLRLVQALAGLYAIANEGWQPNSTESTGYLPTSEAAEAIRGTIRYLREQFPEWASTAPFELDSDFWEQTYPGCDEMTRHVIEHQILDGQFDDGGIR